MGPYYGVLQFEGSFQKGFGVLLWGRYVIKGSHVLGVLHINWFRDEVYACFYRQGEGSTVPKSTRGPLEGPLKGILEWSSVAWYGIVWYRMVWYGMVWYGMVWYGMVWYGMVWYGMVWYGMVWYGMVWYGMVWYGMVWYSVV